MTHRNVTQITKAGSHQGPAFGVPTADPLTPFTRRLLEENRKLKRECGRLWLKAFAPKERQEYLLARLDRVAELIAADERGELDENGYYARVLETFSRSLDDTRQPVEAYVLPRAA